MDFALHARRRPARGERELKLFDSTPEKEPRRTRQLSLNATPESKTGLHLFTSNRLETLAAKLAERLRRPLASALQPEIIVVRNQGMERWLKLGLAERHGIWANYRFLFPEAFGQQVFRAVVPELPPASPLEREVLGWRIMRALPELIQRPEFQPLARYLQDADDPRKRVQLAGKIANLFDQYLVFRPEMVLDWDLGRDNQWQAVLWRAVADEFREQHAAALLKRFAESVRRTTPPGAKLPERISIFGIAALPPFYLDLFAGLANHVEVNLFLLQPSQKYWGDITSSREGERIVRRQRLSAAEVPLLHLETGNRLLASLGCLGRDFLKLVLDAGDWMTDDAFVEPGEDTLLHCLQADILQLRDRGRDADCPPRAFESSDDSIQIHSCHSPLREMEVLYDRMLDWFERDPTLEPRDLVVMMPDIEAYAPFVQAVFGSPEDPARAIPFSVADRGARRQSQIIDTFLELLDLPNTRLGSATVLGVLETPAVRERFGLLETDLETIRGWVEQTRIRWGIDAEDRARLGLPKLSGNTWRDGLDRLLLGYAMAGHDAQAFYDILPYDDLEGGAATVLGRFLEFIERVVGTVQTLQTPRRLDEWTFALEQVLVDFFHASEESVQELQTLRGRLADLRRQQLLSGFDEAVSLATVLERLIPALEEDLSQAGFLNGGVTFCGLKPMRSIPFKIVCLAGMNDNAFPRPAHHLSFDLMAKSPRLGDRSTREDDRYLFLETLLSARQRLYISYVGQSIRDNSEAPPSVLVSELLDYVDQAFTVRSPAVCSPAFRRSGAALAPEDDRRQPGRLKAGLPTAILTRHRLQPFSEGYFKPGGQLFSYSQENGRASDSARRARVAPAPFIGRPLVEPEPEFRVVQLDDLAAFFGNPAKFFLNRRLKIFLPDEVAELEERESFVLDALESYRLKQELLARKLDAQDLAQARMLAVAAGQLPLGAVGRIDYGRARAKVEQFVQRLQRHRPGQALGPLDINLVLDEFRLTGRAVEQTESGLLSYRCASIGAKDILRAWVHHLAANAVERGRTSTLVGADGLRAYAPPADARGLLKDLLDLYWQGLRAPLAFFPNSALAFAEARCRQQKPSGHGKAPLEKARDAWEGTEHSPRPGEKDNAYFDLCFRNQDALAGDFPTLAARVFDPALKLERREDA